VKEMPAMPLGMSGYIEWIPVGIFILILIPPVRRSPYLSAVCRLILGSIFVDFALSKIMRPAVFALNVVEYGMMPAWGVNLWALVLPWGELVAGLFLILGIRTRAAATIIGGMNIIFIIGLVNAIFQGLPITCGCVGEAGEPVNWWKVLKNTGMLVMALQIFFYDRLFVLDRGGFIWRERKI
jgi:putative oxidoreductase